MQKRLQIRRVGIQEADGQAISGFRVTCDCGRSAEVKSQKSKNLPDAMLRKKFQAKGWTFKGTKGVCDRCSAPPEKEGKSVTAQPTNINANVQPLRAEPPREMSRDDKRRIFREIDDNWDEPNGRYIGDASDTALAAKLSVPRSWVEKARVEMFGESGRNEQFDKVLIEIEAKRKSAQKAASEALDLAQRYEALASDFKRISERLQGAI